MLKALLSRLGASQSVSVPDALWQSCLNALPFAARLTDEERVRLRRLCEQLLASKEMASAGGLELTAQIQLNIALQAALPILNLGLDWYEGWSSIVIYPDEFLVPRTVTDDSGVVHEYVEPLAGEAWQGGPMVLSWADAQPHQPHNVVIHEFAHKLDMRNGDADGLPMLDRKLHATVDPQHWMRTLEDALARLNAELELIESTLPADIDPESDAADAYYAHLPIDAYAAQDPAEFFAVSSEAFFVHPALLRAAFPEWYQQLALFYRQDPAQER